MTSIYRKIDKIGKKLVKCPKICGGKGIVNDPKKGIIPRCLFLETEGREKQKGAVIIGFNPGPANKNEQERMKNKISYEDYKNYFKENNLGAYSYDTRARKHHKRAKDLVTALGFKGPILWTELVKCQFKEDIDIKSLPERTMEECIKNYLRKEIKLFPKFPIIALGNDVFEFCSLRFPERIVIGIPHPSGRSRKSNEFYKKRGYKSKRLRKKISKYKKKFKNKPFSIRLS